MDKTELGPRMILRVPDVLMAVATRRGGTTLAELCQVLDMPKSSLHRLLQTLQRGNYLTGGAGGYELGPESFRLANLITLVESPSEFPACARPVLAWLARETQETIILAVPADVGEVMYVDVVDSVRPLRFSVSAGSRRPFYPAVTGMAILAFLPQDEQARHIAEAGNKPFPSSMIRREDLPDILTQIRKRGIAYVRNGSFDGVSAVASPIFAARDNVISSVAVVGPTDRINEHHERIEHLVFAAGERISRMLGFTADYPPEAV